MGREYVSEDVLEIEKPKSIMVSYQICFIISDTGASHL